jgi:exopolysaccharide biosynthesis polyprenyl glycosylphosphotransferase
LEISARLKKIFEGPNGIPPMADGGQFSVEADIRTSGVKHATDDLQAHDPVRVVENIGDLSVVRDADPHADKILAPAPKLSLRAPARNVRRELFAVGLMLAGTDILCVGTALFLSGRLLGTFGASGIPLTMVLIASLVWVSVFLGYRLYGTHHLSAADEFKRVLSATSIGMLLVMVATLGTSTALSRTGIALSWIFALVFELATRRVWRGVLGRWRNGSLSLRTLVIGTGPEAEHLRKTLISENAMGIKPIGHVSLNGDGTPGRSLDDLVDVIRNTQADCLFVASTEVDSAQMMAIRRAARVAGVDLRVSANLPETLSTRLALQPVGDVMTITLRPVRLSGIQAAVKRAMDLAMASIGLLISLPLLGLIAATVKMTSPGQILFKQKRITRGGRPFTMYKFRTMVVGADRVMDDHSVDRSEAFFKLRVEPPLTKVGRVLRKLSLDELPQLWNVLRGEMSIVGPRPLPAEQVAANLELLEYRHEVRAGLTGWWQIHGRSDVEAVDAVRMDLFYIENWSPALDLYIILKTLGIVFLRTGAY